jgi:outer membrane protein assembly factor BamD (BamD/ComL family)
MKSRFQTAGKTGAILLALSAAALADTITKTDGRTIKQVNVVEEGLNETSYRKGNATETVPSEEVLTVTYDRKPRLVDEADQALFDGDAFAALQLFDQYADGQINKRDTRDKWAGPYAAWRSIQVCQLLDDVAGVVQRTERLIHGFPDSRFVPAAYLARADAQVRNKGGDAAARKTLEDLAALVDSKGLSQRYALDAKLGLVLTDADLSAGDKRDQLEGITSEAGSEFPTVGNRAQVAIGETYVGQIETASEDKKLELARQARKVFQRIVADQKAEPETLAAAYTGLGTAQFHESALAKDSELAHEALMNFMRVIVNHKEQSRYVAQSMFYAMLCFRAAQDETSLERSQEMRYKLIQRYPGSNWAKEAQNSR